MFKLSFKKYAAARNLAVKLSCFGLLMFGGFAAAQAQEIRAEVRNVNGQKEVVYTNEGNDRYRNSVKDKNGTHIITSDYPTVKRRGSKAKKNAAAPPKTETAKTAAKPEQKETALKSAQTPAKKSHARSAAKRNPDGTMEFAPVKYEVVKTDSYSPYGGDWAFATFNPKKRKPRMITYYGWDYNDPNQTSRTWVSVDINPIILKYSKIWGVDPLLIEIIIRHESNFNPNAVSPVGALGLMQLMPETAAGMGILDAFDVEQNIAGGVRYVAGQLERFNSVPLALAAYNAGPGAVLQYGGVPPYAETRYYVDTIYGEYLAGKKARESE